MIVTIKGALSHFLRQGYLKRFLMPSDEVIKIVYRPTGSLQPRDTTVQFLDITGFLPRCRT